MKIVVLNGSPKGDVSVTRQYVLSPGKGVPPAPVRRPARGAAVQEAGAGRRGVRRGHRRGALGGRRDLGISRCTSCWSARSTRGSSSSSPSAARQSAFHGKHAVTLSTSINYYDSNAHVYMRSVCEDLGMRFVGIHSANMHDLMKKEERDRLHLFAEDFFSSIQAGMEFPRLSAALPRAAGAAYRHVSPVHARGHAREEDRDPHRRTARPGKSGGR